MIIDLLNTFLQKVSKDNYEYLYLSIIIIIALLLFKQFKNNITDSNEKEELQVREGINLLVMAILAIKRYKSKAIDLDLLYVELYKVLPYATKDLQKHIFDMDIDDFNINEIEELLKNNYYSIRYMLKQDIVKRSSSLFSDNIYYVINRSKFYNIFIPLVYTLFSIFMLIITITLLFNIQHYETLQIINFTVLISSVLIYLNIIINMADIISEKRFNIKPETVILLTILVLSFLFLLVKIFNIGIYIFFGYELFYVFYAVKISVKRNAV